MSSPYGMFEPVGMAFDVAIGDGWQYNGAQWSAPDNPSPIGIDYFDALAMGWLYDGVSRWTPPRGAFSEKAAEAIIAQITAANPTATFANTDVAFASVGMTYQDYVDIENRGHDQGGWKADFVDPLRDAVVELASQGPVRAAAIVITAGTATGVFEAIGAAAANAGSTLTAAEIANAYAIDAATEAVTFEAAAGAAVTPVIAESVAVTSIAPGVDFTASMVPDPLQALMSAPSATDPFALLPQAGAVESGGSMAANYLATGTVTGMTPAAYMTVFGMPPPGYVANLATGELMPVSEIIPPSTLPNPPTPSPSSGSGSTAANIATKAAGAVGTAAGTTAGAALIRSLIGGPAISTGANGQALRPGQPGYVAPGFQSYSGEGLPPGYSANIIPAVKSLALPALIVAVAYGVSQSL